MKKITSIISSIALMATLFACKKDRTCECTVTAGGMSVVTQITLVKVTKKQAKDICVSRVDYDSNGQVTTQTDCKLK